MFSTIPLNIIGGTHRSRSRYFSNQSTLNLYLSASPQSRTPVSLLPWPGEKTFFSASGLNRGIFTHNKNLYQVKDQSLYEISSSGVATLIGSIPGAERCRFSSDGNNLIIRNGTSTYKYDGSITPISVQNGKTVTYMSTFTIYQGLGNAFGVSDAGDPSTVTDYASAEAFADDLLQVKVFGERLYLGGEQNIEVWGLATAGPPYFEKINGATMNIGVASADSMDFSENFLYWLGSDNAVYRTSAYQPDQVSTEDISAAIRDDGGASSALCKMVKLDGQNFFIIQLSNATLVYCELSNEWVSLSTGVNGDGHLMQDYAFCYGKHYVADKRSGNIYEWDYETNTSNGDPIIRQRVSAPLSSNALGVDGHRLVMSGADILMETGVGSAGGQGENPRIMVSASYDGGNSFSNEDTVLIGRTGESFKRVTWFNSASFYEIIVKIRVSDPNFISIHGANIRVKKGGF